jgi:hypothetical protein
MSVAQQRPGAPSSPGELAPGIGVSPATGKVPTLPPEKAMPDKP